MFGVDTGREEGVVVVHEVDTRDLDKDAVATAIRRAVTRDYGIDLHAVVLIRARTIPKTTSGKIQRRATRDAFLAGELVAAVFEWRKPAVGAAVA